MITRLKDFYKEPAAITPICDKQLVDKTYKAWRIRIFLTMFLGYIAFYLCRKNISVALPSMGESLGYSNTELGLLGSSLYLTYAVGKFINGIIADNTNVKKVLPTALIISAIANLCFVASAIFITPGKTSFFGLPTASILLWVMAFFWGLNGWFQSMGFPPIAKNLSYWFCNKERGFKWSLWSSSHEIGTYLSVILSGFLVMNYGWKMAFVVPSFIAVICSVLMYFNLQDKPSSLGLPDIEVYKGEGSNSLTCEIPEDEESGLSYMQIFKKYILTNKTIWLLAFAYIFVYVTRYGTIDWIVKYLVEAKHYTIGAAAERLSFLPLFGTIGTIGAGLVSDTLFKGKRAPVNIICLSLLALCIYLFKDNTNMTLDYVYVSLIGIFTCGPQVLIGGLSAVESSSKKVASAATGFCGMFGYIGAVLSGVGTGAIIDRFSWNGAVLFWIFSALSALAICVILLKGEIKK